LEALSLWTRQYVIDMVSHRNGKAGYFFGPVHPNVFVSAQ